jgi:hypothetical protein
MSINFTFTGTANSTYTPPGTALLYGTMAYNAAGNGIRPVNDNFSQLVDVIAAETTGYSEAVIDFTLATAGAEAGLCFIDGTRSGFSLIITSSALVLRKEVSGSAGSTIASLSTTNSGSATYRVSITLSTGDIVVTKNSTQVLTGTYTDIASGLRPGIQSYIYDGTGASYASLVTSTGTGVARTIDSIGSSGVVTLGATGTAITTTGLGTLTSLTIGGVAVTALSAAGGDGTFTAPAMAEGLSVGLIGAAVGVIAGDGTNTASTTCTLALPTGWSYITLAGTLNTSTTSLLYNAAPAVAAGDQIVGETAKITLYQSLDAETDYVGTQTLYHIDATDGVWRSFSLTTGNAGGSTATPSGTSLSLQVGTAVARGSASVTPAGRSLSLVVGTATASGGAGSPGNATPSGVSVSLQVGTSVGRGSATATPAGVSLSLTNGTPVARGAAIVQAVGVVINLVSGLISFPRTDESPNLPTFLVESVSKLRKTFRKSFRKK